MAKKKLSKTLKAVIVCSSVVVFLLSVLLGLYIGMWATEMDGWTPDYDMVNISPVLEKEELSDEDYELLYRQTGLTRIGVDRMLERGTVGKSKMLEIQKNFFAEHEEVKFRYFILCQEHISSRVSHVYLENGDIIMTSSTHISGFRLGHSALVVNEALNRTLEANSYGEKSAYGTSSLFTGRINFLVYSPKVDKETKEKVVEYATENLLGIDYDAFVGILSKKDRTDKTQCAHLIWEAYNHFGIDLDSNGGGLVKPRDMANSPHMELVQVFGMDIDKLWT